jgi:hypothetical protein
MLFCHSLVVHSSGLKLCSTLHFRCIHYFLKEAGEQKPRRWQSQSPSSKVPVDAQLQLLLPLRLVRVKCFEITDVRTEIPRPPMVHWLLAVQYYINNSAVSI